MKNLFSLMFLFLTAAAWPSFVFGAEQAKKDYTEVEITVDKNFLQLPMNGEDPYRTIRLVDPANGSVIAEFDALLAESEPIWYADMNISGFKGRKLLLQYKSEGKPVASITQSDTPARISSRANRARPTYHLTPKDGWMGSIYGLVYFKGMWHAFYQYNPFAMTDKMPVQWGHAASKDLVNWEYRPSVMFPSFLPGGQIEYPTAASAYYDKSNRSGLFSTSAGGVIFAYSTTTRGDCLLITEDMETFREVSFNPILKGESKSLKIFYNEDSSLWTIVRMEDVTRVDEIDGSKSVETVHGIYVSKNLRSWERTSEITGKFVDAQLVKMPLVGAPDAPKWVLFDGTGRYAVGEFDGRKFTRLKQSSRRIFFGDAASAQIWNNTPGGRILATAWIQQPGDLMRTVGQAFSQCMSIPWGLRLVKSVEGEYQLRAKVCEEIERHISEDGTDGVGYKRMGFTSNTFMLPDAVGNSQMIMGAIECFDARSVIVEVGTAHFSYAFDSGVFLVSRLITPRHSGPIQSKLRKEVFEFKLFQDTYSAEMFVQSGEAVLFAGDSYINPQQEIRVGAVGHVVISWLYKFPIYRHDISQRNEIKQKMFEKMYEAAQ